MARRNWYEAAGILWPVLTDLAAQRKTATYGELSPLVATNPLSMGMALGPIMFYCVEKRLPPLTALVIGKHTGVPGGGFSAWDVDDLPSALEAVFAFPWSTVSNPFSGFRDGVGMDDLVTKLVEEPATSAEVYRLVPDRGVAQTIFRSALLRAYGQCGFCGLTFEQALEAAHIIRWSEATASERLNVCNGVLLCATHHRMFDSGLIELDEDLRIEFYDPEEEDEPYSAMDKIAASELHGQSMMLPDDLELAPSVEFIKRRRKADSW